VLGKQRIEDFGAITKCRILQALDCTREFDQPAPRRQVEYTQCPGYGEPLSARDRDPGPVVHQDEIGGECTRKHEGFLFPSIERVPCRIVNDQRNRTHF
jgi:hypothetical protein